MKIPNLPKRPKKAHKKDFGHVFILAGSPGLTGAAYLCSQTAMLTGSGLVTLGITESLNDIMEKKLTEVMTLPLPETKDKTLSLKAQNKILKFMDKTDVLAIGPGLSQNKQTQKLILNLLPKIKKPVVLDADGLNALALNPDVLLKRKFPTVITPHPGEMSRLIKKSASYVNKNRQKTAKDFAKKYKIVVVLKGADTIVTDGRKIHINKTGNSGLATAGTGDVLTGMIASLVGQKLKPLEAAILGTYLHGKTGDLVSKKKGQRSLIASDLLTALPKILK